MVKSLEDGLKGPFPPDLVSDSYDAAVLRAKCEKVRRHDWAVDRRRPGRLSHHDGKWL